jgi:hypothetical protein
MTRWLSGNGHSHNEFTSRELGLMHAAWRAARGDLAAQPPPLPACPPMHRYLPPEAEQALARVLAGEHGVPVVKPWQVTRGD